MPFTNSDLYSFNSNWNEVPVVYGILDIFKRVLYIGETNNLKRRMAEHQADAAHLMHRHSPMYVIVEIIYDEKTRCARERQLILEYNPPCNLC